MLCLSVFFFFILTESAKNHVQKIIDRTIFAFEPAHESMVLIT